MALAPFYRPPRLEQYSQSTSKQSVYGSPPRQVVATARSSTTLTLTFCASTAHRFSAATELPTQQPGACPFNQPPAARSGLTATTGASVPSSAAGSFLENLQVSAAGSDAGLGILGVSVTPGPPAFSLQAALDVSHILFGGIHRAMLYFAARYGSVCRFANPTDLNGATGWLFLNSPDCVQHICSSNVKNYQRRYLPDIYSFVTHGKGILGSQDEYNKRHRRLCQPPFRSPKLLQHFTGVITGRCLELVDIWRQHHGAFEADVALHTQRLTLDIVGLVAFSHDFGNVEQTRREQAGQMPGGAHTEDRLLWAVNTFGEILAQVFITPMPVLKFLDRIGMRHLRTLDEAVSVLRSSMLHVIQERRDALAAGAKVQDDLLGVLLEAEDDFGNRMTDEELWEDVHDIMGAGHETTATTSAAALYCIAAHPEVEALVLAELDRVLAGAPAQFGDLEHLVYLGQTVKEVLRLYPAIPIFPRVALMDDVLPTGDRVCAGDVVFMSSYALGRSPDLWEDVLEFRPERFAKAEEEKRHRYQWLPFGAGPRMCLGAGFAQMSVTLTVATLLQHFCFQPKRPNSRELPVDYDITMNFNKTNGLLMKVLPRHGL